MIPVNYFRWSQMSKAFMKASFEFIHCLDKRMYFAALYGNHKAELKMYDAIMMYTMGGEMQ